MKSICRLTNIAVLFLIAVLAGAEIGKAGAATLDDVKAGNFQTRMSPHQLGLLEILEVSKLRDAAPDTIEFYTVIPKDLNECIELSTIVEQRKVEVAEMIITRLRELGVEVSGK